MADEQALAQLKDIHLPGAIGWWPLAPGWYLLSTLLTLLLCLALYLAYKRYKNGLAKKQALQLLARYQQQYNKEGNAQLTSALISELLKRVALVYYPREQVASMYGEQWLEFLNHSSNNIDFNQVRAMLLDSPFKRGERTDLAPLIGCAQLWIKQRGTPCSN